MHLYIRADADSKMGTGHIMRCIALAQTWQDQGGEVTFISHCESDALKERIQSEGFRFIALVHASPDPYDLQFTLSTLKSESANQKNWLVLDGYYFTPEYQKSIRDEGYCLMVIDDMNHLPQYHADILLNQNIFNETNIEQVSAYVKSDNEASLRVFQKAGFNTVEEVDISGVNSRKMILNRMEL